MRAMSRRTSAALAVMGLFAAKGCFVVLDYSEYQPGQGGAGGSSGPGGGQGGLGGGGAGGAGGVSCEGGGQQGPERAGNMVDEDCNGSLCAPPGWTVRAGSSMGTEYVALTALAVPADVGDGIFVAGHFDGTFSLPGGNPEPSAGVNLWAAKLSDTGQAEWVHPSGAGGAGGEGGAPPSPWGASPRASAITINGAAQAVVTGSQVAASGAQEAFVTTVGSGGNPQFRRIYPPPGSASAGGRALAAANGAVFVGGNFDGTVTVDGKTPEDSHASSNGSRDIVLAKYTTTLSSLQWSQRYGGAADDEVFDIAVDGDGNVLLIGSYRGQFAGTSDNAGTTSDILVMKVLGTDDPPTGVPVWTAGFVSSSDSHDAAGRAIAVDGAGDIVITGKFYGQTMFGSHILDSVVAITSDIFVAKLDPSGAVTWARSFGGSGDDIGTDVAVDANGNIRVTGVFSDTLDLGPGGQLDAQGEAGLFFLELNGQGDVVCSGSFATGGAMTAGQAAEQLGLVAVTPVGNIMLAGTWGAGQLDFGAGARPAPGTGLGIFVNRFGP